MKTKQFFMLAGICICCVLSTDLKATTFYVAPNGDDNNSGSKDQPFATVQRAQNAVEPGDTVYIRGGVYLIPAGQIAANEEFRRANYACVTYLTKSGTPQKRICYFAYPGEKPKFDLSQVKPKGKRVSAFWIDADWLHLKGIEVVGVQVTITGQNTQSECFSNNGSHNIYELLEMHDAMGIGFFSRGGGNNLILNCDAWRNYDPVCDTAGGANGGNVDGFGSHYSNPEDGPNIFRGCRAWYNSDDGFDCINNGAATIIENCWAFYNGYSCEGPDDAFHLRGDGNGLKSGGYGRGPKLSNLPVPVPRNIVRFCLAVGNKSKGFDANYHADGILWYNNTAYRNNHNFHMETAGKISPEDTILTFVPGRNHVLINNLSYKGRTTNLTRIDVPTCIMINNNFDTDGVFTDANFVNLDEAELTTSRKPDGSLPDINFMKTVNAGAFGLYAKP
ncbi:MAG: DUF4990 domain-containing protein [Tannerella sp.]|jgi:hypothetical protein|nr:DUF4990 domain-containing protein [Tannerella sp.]